VHLLRGGEVGGGRDIAVEKFSLNMFLRSSAEATCTKPNRERALGLIGDFTVHPKWYGKVPD
jgi:hypothetical protein